jgi:mono/diheme cytochrome c family protein
MNNPKEVEMFTRIRIALGLALVLSLLLAVPAFAGGWAVITLDELSTEVVAGEPMTIGFTVLQHGKTPLDGLDPTITANLYKEQEIVVHAEPDGKPGHYVATIIFPKEGEWTWSIQAFTMDQPMPSLQVAALHAKAESKPVVQSEPVPAPAPSLLTVVRLSALGVGVAGLALVFRRRTRLAAGLVVVSLLVGLGSFAAAPAVPEVEAQGQSSPKKEAGKETSISQVELGEQLFVAKGCITCHANSKVSNSFGYMKVNAGPDLTKFSASPEALRLRLKDPASVKSDTQMPNLSLSETEIEALIAFINSK